MNKYVIILLFISFSGLAQTKPERNAGKRLFAGNWINYKTQRQLSISFEPDNVLINDWSPNHSTDAYSAYLTKGKLVLPEDKTDHYAPYCEIIRQRNKLLYRCRGLNTKDLRFISHTWFTRKGK